MRAKYLCLCRLQTSVILLHVAQGFFNIALLEQRRDILAVVTEIVTDGFEHHFVLACKRKLSLQVCRIFFDELHFAFIVHIPNRFKNDPQHRAINHHDDPASKTTFSTRLLYG